MLQNEANNKMFGHSWLEEPVKVLPYYRASMVEAVEALVKMGYKWWKKAEDLDEVQIEAIRIELIDILHFVLSDEIRAAGSIEKALVDYEETVSVLALYGIGSFAQQDFANLPGIKPSDEMPSVYIVTDIDLFSFNDLCEQLIFTALLQGRANLTSLTLLFDKIGMTANDVYLRYTAKHTLNMFRNVNGQKEGTYKKVWNGVEDDVILANYIQQKGEHLTKESLYAYLTEQYKRLELS
jgi:hypothetical protein